MEILQHCRVEITITSVTSRILNRDRRRSSVVLPERRKKYAIEIESLDYSGREANKGILFRVTDEQLLDMTGGIVQGMSGSPSSG